MTAEYLEAFVAYMAAASEELETVLGRGDAAAAVAVLQRIAADTSPQVADRMTRRVVAQGLRRLADQIERTGGEL